jgi:hypothetical protein
MAFLDRTANTISEFRQKVLDKRGLQQVSKYYCTFSDPLGEILRVYPESITLPQRSFVQAPFSYWGPVEQIPIRREYGECAMTFLIYQDWLERKYFERWMNMVIPTWRTQTAPTEGIGFERTIVPVANPFNWEVDANKYTDYSNTIDKQLGSITVYMQAAEDHVNSTNAICHMVDAYPLSITPTSLSSESSGYGTFVVVFSFREYGFY